MRADWREDRNKALQLAAMAEQAIRDGFPVQKTRTQPPKERTHAWAAALARARKVAKKKGSQHD